MDDSDNYTPADGGQSSSQADTPSGPPAPAAGSPGPPADDTTANQCTPEQNYTPADPGGQTSSQPNPAPTADSSQADHSGDGSGGVVTASAAPLLAPSETPTESPPDWNSGQAANDNALSGEAANDNALSSEPANDNAVVDETATEGTETATEVGEGVETGEEVVEATETVEVLEGAEVLGALLAPEVVIPLLILGAVVVLASDDDDPVAANSASEQQPDQNVDNTTGPCDQPEPTPDAPYSPVIPGQKYSDQTCTDAEREEITARQDAIKQRLDDIGSAQVPKTSYNDQLANAKDQKTRDKILRRQLELCQKLNDMLKERQALLDVRNEMQNRCFNSPKTTEDEKERDAGHQQQLQEVQKAIDNLKAQIQANC